MENLAVHEAVNIAILVSWTETHVIPDNGHLPFPLKSVSCTTWLYDVR